MIDYAKWLGMDLEKEKDLMWIAREGLKAPLPDNWKPCKAPDTGDIYYFNFQTGESVWDHPCDEYYKNLYATEKANLEKRACASASDPPPRPSRGRERRRAFDREHQAGSDRRRPPALTRSTGRGSVPSRPSAAVLTRWIDRSPRRGRWGACRPP